MRCNVTHVVQALKKQDQDENHLFELQNAQLG